MVNTIFLNTQKYFDHVKITVVTVSFSMKIAFLEIGFRSVKMCYVPVGKIEKTAYNLYHKVLAYNNSYILKLWKTAYATKENCIGAITYCVERKGPIQKPMYIN